MFNIDILSHYLSTKGFAENPFYGSLLYLSLTLGALSISSYTLKILSFIYRHTLQRQLNFQKIYSNGDSWAVITGGSDGIGEQFCHDLAAQGFNICIIARNEEKMKQKLKEIAVAAKKPIKTRYVVADFAALTKYADYATIASQIADIDIAMLILNAGWTVMGPFKDLTSEEVEQTVTINALHPVYLSKALLA